MTHKELIKIIEDHLFYDEDLSPFVLAEIIADDLKARGLYLEVTDEE